MSRGSPAQPDPHRRLQRMVLLAATAACLAAVLLVATATQVQRQEAIHRATFSGDNGMLLAAIGCVALMLGALVRVVQIASHLTTPTPLSEYQPQSGHIEGTLRRAELQIQAAELQRSLTERVLRVGRATVGVLDLDALVRGTVEAISRDFEPACVGLFLVDDRSGVISLRTGLCEKSGVPAPHIQALGEGHSRLGWCITNAQPRVSSGDVADLLLRGGAGSTHEARTEAVLPIRDRGRAIGALVLQNQGPPKATGEFSEATLSALQEIADQLGGAIGVACAFAEAQGALRSAREALGQVGRDAISRALLGDVSGYRRLPDGTVEPTQDEWEDDAGQAVAENHTMHHDRTLIMPIRIWDAPVGAVRLQKADEVVGWTNREIALAEAVVEQLGYALGSARVHTELRAVRGQMQLTHTVAERLDAAQDWDALMQTAVDEIGRAVHASRVYVQWTPAEPGKFGRALEAGPQDGEPD